MSAQPSPAPGSADDEWAAELAASWIETYKKSATTLAVLRIIGRIGPAPAAAIAAQLERDTGWGVTERGLYRTLRRLADARVLEIVQVPVARTGRPRQDVTLTEIGAGYLARIEQAHGRLSDPARE